MTENTLGAPAPPVSSTIPGPWRLVDVLLIAVVSVVVLIAGTVLLKQLNADPLTLTIGAVALEGVTLVGSVYLFGLRRKGLSWQAVGLRPAPAEWVWVSIAAGVACLFLTGIVALIVQILLGRPPTNPQLPALIPKGLTAGGEVAMFLLAGLFVPFAEELFFRGVLYTWLREHWSFWPSAIASALLFGAAHGDIAIAAGVAVMGLIQAWVFERSRSLWTTFIIHALNNSVKLLLLYALLAAGLKLS
jgi:membrane protease YdiL (CAAX protease family)